MLISLTQLDCISDVYILWCALSGSTIRFCLQTATRIRGRMPSLPRLSPCCQCARAVRLQQRTPRRQQMSTTSSLNAKEGSHLCWSVRRATASLWISRMPLNVVLERSFCTTRESGLRIVVLGRMLAPFPPAVAHGLLLSSRTAAIE